jgi:predicted PurR-regulated permease PerM
MQPDNSQVHLYGTEMKDEKPFAVATVSGPEPPKPAGWQISTGTVVRIMLVILAVLFAAWAIYRILPILLLLLIAIMLATAIEPVVNNLRRGPFSRSQGILIVYTGIFIVLLAIGWLIVPVFINQVGEVLNNLPKSISDFKTWAGTIHDPFLRNQVTQAANALDALFRDTQRPAGGTTSEQVASVSSVVLGLAETGLSIIVLFVIAFYWMTERTRIKRWIVSLLPADRGNRIRRVWDEIEVKVGGWVRGQLTLMALVGLISALGYFVIGVRYWPALALFIALAEAVPLVGPYIGTAPAVLVALTQPGNDGLPLLLDMGNLSNVTRALLVIVFAVVLQTVEANVLVPSIMRNSVGISALTVIVSLLIGSALAGLAGALLAVPIAGAIQVIIMDLQAAATARAEAEKRAAQDAAEKEHLEHIIVPSDETAHTANDAPKLIVPGAAGEQ